VLAGRDKSDISDQRGALSLFALLPRGSPRLGCGEDQEAEHMIRIVVEVFWDAEACAGARGWEVTADSIAGLGAGVP
jgi:hypothetical protein